MKRVIRPLLALTMVAVMMPAAQASDYTGYASDPFASQISFDAFNQSVKKRMQSARIGSSTQYFGSAPILVQSEDAYAMAPSSRSSSVAADTSRRQLDCSYYNGFTVWGDYYSTWAKQTSRSGNDGYRYRAMGPALGFDWSNGPLTLGVASTYNWGKIKRRDSYHQRKTETWALELYGQYNTERFYVNASAAYSRTRFKSDRGQWNLAGTSHWDNSDRYHSNAWNFDGEFGWKFGVGSFKIVPNIGLRYFHDREISVSEGGNDWRVNGDRKYYHVLELPVGVDLSTEIAAGNTLLVPRLRLAWIPELGRKRGNFTGSVTDNSTGATYSVNDSAAKRGRQGFQVGGGLEAKITKAISAHVDYNLNFRHKQWEQRVNVGLGFTF